jgi:hypothetical protein
MTLKQINLKLPEKLFVAAAQYVEQFGYRNIQDLAAESMREKIFKNAYDETFSDNEILLIDKLITVSKNKLVSEEELNKVLLE